MADEDTLDISYQLESIEVAVECIRGDLKQLAFGKFLRRASELLVSLANSVADGIWISTAGSFLKSVYEKASEAERVKFAELIQDHLCVVSHLVEVTCLILKGEISLLHEPAKGVCALLEVVLKCYDDGYKIKAWLQKQKYTVKIIHSLEIYLGGRDLCKMDSMASLLLHCCLEILCLSADNQVSCKQYYEAGCLQLMHQLSNISVLSLCVLSKALAGFVAANTNEFTPEFVILTDNEVKMLYEVLKSGSDFSLGISKCFMTDLLLKGLMKCKENIFKFKRHNLLTLLQQRMESSKLSVADEILVSLQGMSISSSTKEITSQPDDHDPRDPHEQLEPSSSTDVNAPKEKQTVSMVSEFTEYFIRVMLQLDAPKGMLSSAEFDNVAAVLLLIEELILESCDNEKKEIKHTLCGTSDVAKSASLLMEHLNDEGTSAIFRRCSLRAIVTMMMDLTDYSLKMCKELALTGFVAYLVTFLDVLDKTKMFEEGVAGLVQLMLTVILNCVNEPSSLPVFEACNAAECIIPYLQCPIFDIAILGKIILSFLTSHLTNEQFLYLALEIEEAEYLVSTFSEAVEAPDLRAERNSITEILQYLINFSRLHGEEVREDDDKQLKRKTSNFKSDYVKRKDVSHNNIQTIAVLGIFSSLETLLGLPNIEHSVMAQALHLLWNLLHVDSLARALPSSLREIVLGLKPPPDSEVQSLVLCVWWVLGYLDKEDMSICLQYAKTCFTHGNFHECATICVKVESRLISVDQEAGFKSDIDLIFGKAMYHAYQPELWHLIKRRDYLSTEEQNLVSAECFVKIKKVISHLGNALDNENIDYEGSKLLDLALTACALDLNFLHLCGRCLLCRRGGQKLRKSHLWPNSILKRIYKSEYEGFKKPFLFRSHPRSGKECTFYMFCPSCEELLSQNGEEQFAKFLDCLQEQPVESFTYGSWLYDFAIGMMFRQLATESMSYSVNSHKVYNVFLLCRKHLFTLSTKMNNKILPPLSETSKYQFQRICTDVFGDVSIFMMHCNVKLAKSKDEMTRYFGEYCHCCGSVATCRLVDAKLDLSGQVHFIVIYCNSVHFLLTFEASESLSIPRQFLIHQQPSESQLSAIPTKDVASSIPDGVWSVLRQVGAISLKSRMDCYQAISERTLQILNTPSHPSGQADSEKGSISHQFEMLHVAANDITHRDTGPPVLTLPSFYSFSLLPTNYQVGVGEKLIQLPMGHKVVLHISGSVDGLLQTCFLCVKEDTIDFYVIFIYNDAESGLQLMEGVSISAEDEPKVIEFLLEDRSGLEKLPHPFSIDDMQVYVGEQVPSLLYSKGIKSMAQLQQLIKCRRSIDETESIPSLDTKCFPDGCWYCKNLCHCCMRKIPLWTAQEAEQTPGSLALTFCGEECRHLVHPKPGSPPKVSAIYHQKKPGKAIGPAKLQVTKSILSSGAEFSQLEFIDLCISDGSEGIPPEKPYIMWQIRSVDCQKFMDFFITDNFEPVKCLWTSKLPQLNVSLEDSVVKSRIYQLLTNVLTMVLKNLGYGSLESFVVSNLPDDSSQQ